MKNPLFYEQLAFNQSSIFPPIKNDFMPEKRAQPRSRSDKSPLLPPLRISVSLMLAPAVAPAMAVGLAHSSAVPRVITRTLWAKMKVLGGIHMGGLLMGTCVARSAHRFGTNGSAPKDQSYQVPQLTASPAPDQWSFRRVKLLAHISSMVPPNLLRLCTPFFSQGNGFTFQQ